MVPLRIALLSAEYPPQPGGVGDYTHRLGEALATRGHAVFVFTIADGLFQIVDLNGPCQDAPFADRRSNWGWSCWRDVIAALDQTRPDVLHLQYQTGAYGMHPAINLLPWRLRRLPARPMVAVTAHDLLPPYLFPKAGRLRHQVTRRLLADADAVVLTNEEDYAQVASTWRMVDGSRIVEVIPIGSNIAVAPPPGYDRAAWRARLGVRDGEMLVAYFGLISRSKGLDTLLRGLAQLAPRYRLQVIGGAATAPADRAFASEAHRLVEQLDLRERVIFSGHCPAPEVSGHLLAADMAALPFADGASFRRGSLLAALAHGVPIITTHPPSARAEIRDQGSGVRSNLASERRRWALDRLNISAHSLNASDRQLLQDPLIRGRLVEGENALLTPPGDARTLAAALERLAGDAALRERLRAGGQALAVQFGWEAIAARHEAMYRRRTENKEQRTKDE